MTDHDVRIAGDEAKIARVANQESDFEAHRLAGPEKVADVAEARAEDEGPDFEAHRLAGPEKVAKIAKLA